MSDLKEDMFNNLKLVIAENLKTLPNFNEDVNYVAEYIVLLMSNGGNLESVVQELTSLFDTVPAEASFPKRGSECIPSYGIPSKR